MKKNKIILVVLILSIIALIFSGCGEGGNPITPPDDTEDSDIPEPTEAISQKIDLSIGGTIEVTDEESPINGVKLIIPPMQPKRDGKASIANIAINYLDNPYAVGLPDNQGFLRTPLVISSDVILDTDCILKIPYTDDDLSNAGASSNDTVNVYRYDYNSSSWEKIIINKKIHKDTSDIIEIIFRPEDVDSPYACTILDSYPPSDLGLPQPGDLLYKLGSILPWEKEAKGWRPGHVGIYVGDLVYDGVVKYNVIEALLDGVKRTYKNPISAFSGSDTYMGARQPESGALTSKQREDIVWYVEDKVDKPYAIGQSVPGIIFGMLRGDLVKGALGTYNCVGLAEAAYEYAGVNGGQGLVSDWAEGNFCTLPTCILTPAEQYNKTEPATGINEEELDEEDFIHIISVTPDSGLVDGVDTDFTVVVEYNLFTYNQGILYIGFNNEESNTFLLVNNADFLVNKGSGAHEFNVTVKPKDWGSQGDFKVYVNISKYPHPNHWTPLDSDTYALAFN